MSVSLPESFFPKLLTPLPGPKTAALIQKDHQYLSPSYTRDYPLSIARGEGCMVEDLDGNRFLDCCAGIAVCATGHSHPQVVAAIQEQAGQFLHMSGTDFYYQVMADLAEQLALTAPGPHGQPLPRRVFFANSGAEANEGAMKLARYATGRQHIIAFQGSFHGRTYGALSLGASKVVHRKGFSPLVAGVVHAPYPNPYRALPGESPDACALRCLDFIEQVLFKSVVNSSEVAAFFLEPIQGEGGYVVPPDSFLLGLQALAQKHGILLVADEVQSGMGRTGKLWAYEHVPGFAPDIVTSAKGIASGLPLGAVIARAELMTWPPGAHASTFGGNPLACVAALKTLDLLHTGLMANAHSQGERLQNGLRQLAGHHPILGDVRGRGLMVGVEIVTDGEHKTRWAEGRNALVQECFSRGLLVLGCGENTIRWCPPLVLHAEQVDAALGIFEQAVLASSP